jgi:hypothetical protein
MNCPVEIENENFCFGLESAKKSSQKGQKKKEKQNKLYFNFLRRILFSLIAFY